jgi:SAM-dependent methyltransferase
MIAAAGDDVARGPAVRWSYDAGARLGRWRSARLALGEKGFFYVARMAALAAAFPLWRLVDKVFPRSFAFQAARYRYFLHGYNLTWSNERAVEIPIVLAEVRARRGGRVLEVGNVLSHYADVRHEVIDKFERGPGIRNDDAATFRDAALYDLIVSISTLEHVGWDEAPRDPSKPLRAIRALRSALAPGGLLVITAPVGYNPALDAAFRSGEAGLSRAAALRREPGTSRWRELAPDDVWTTPYDFLIFRARAVLLGFIDAPQA